MRIDTIKVEMEDGSMTIDLDKFFPCGQARFNKLSKIIRRYPWLNDIRTIAGQLEQNFTDRIQGLDDLRGACAERYLKKMQEQADYRGMVSSGKDRNGIPLTKERARAFKAYGADAMGSARACLREQKKLEREMAALKKDLEMLGSLEM